MHRERRTGADLLVWPAVVLLILYLVVLGAGSSGALFGPRRILSLAITAAVFAVWIVAAIRSPRWRPSSRLTPLLAVALAAFAIATVTSWNPRISVEFLAYAVLLIGLYLLLVRLLADSFLRERIAVVVVGLAAVIPALYVAVVVQAWIGWWGIVGRLAIPPLRPSYEGLTLNSPNTVAAITILLAASAVAVVGTATRGRRLGSAAIVVLATVAVVLTGSRGGWLGAAAGIAAIAVLVLVRPADRARLTGALRRVPRPALVGAIVVAGIGLVLVGPIIVRRLLSGGGDDLRVDLLATAARMFAEAPLVGSGPGTWVVRRTAFTMAGETDYYIPHAHNVPAQSLAEFGLLAVVVAIVGLVVVGRLVWPALADAQPTRRRFAWAAVFALVAFFAHQLVDFFVNAPELLFVAAFPIAWLDATAPTPDRASGAPARARPRWLELAAGAGAIAVVVIALAVLARIEAVALAEDRAARAAEARDWPAAVADARTAAVEDPDLPLHHLLVGLAAANAGDLDEAAAELDRATATDDFPEAWLDLAIVEHRRGDDTAARAALERALRLGVQQPVVTMAAAALLLDLGDEARARDLFAATVLAAPTLADDPYWTSTPELAAMRDQIVDAAIARAEASGATETAATIALYAGRPDEAREQGESMAEDGRAFLDLVVDAWTGDADARAAIAAMADADPSDRRALLWSARLAERAGDIPARQRYVLWAAASAIPDDEIGYDTAVTDRPSPNAQVVGSNAYYHGWYTYRRFLPWDLVVDGVPKLTLE